MTKNTLPAPTDKIEAILSGGEVVRYDAWLEPLPWSADEDDASAAIVAAILAAPNIDQLLTPTTTAGLGDYVGKLLTIHDVRLRPSDMEGGTGAYAVLDITVEGSSDHVVATTGARNVLAQLVRAWQLDAFPFSCRITETQSKRNPARTVQWLVTTDAF